MRCSPTRKVTSGWLSLRFSFGPIYNHYYYYIISYYSFFTVEVFFFLFRDVAVLGSEFARTVVFYILSSIIQFLFFSCAAVSVRFTFVLTFDWTWYAAFCCLVYVYTICALLSLWLWLICYEPDMLDCCLWNLSYVCNLNKSF